jgi:hypothetical protein
VNNNYNSNTVVKQDFAVVKQVDGRAAHTGLEITADQRSMIGRKLFLIGEEATLPFILIGKKYI